MKISFNKSLPEIHEEPVYSETKEVVCNSCNKKLGNIIFLPEVKLTQKIKCICPCGGESFLMTINGKVYLDFDNLKDLDVDNEVYTIWLS